MASQETQSLGSSQGGVPVCPDLGVFAYVWLHGHESFYCMLFDRWPPLVGVLVCPDGWVYLLVCFELACKCLMHVMKNAASLGRHNLSLSPQLVGESLGWVPLSGGNTIAHD